MSIDDITQGKPPLSPTCHHDRYEMPDGYWDNPHYNPKSYGPEPLDDTSRGFAGLRRLSAIILVTFLAIFFVLYFLFR